MLLKDKKQPVATSITLNEDSQSVLDKAIVTSQQFLSQFAESDVFLEKITSIFGNNFDADKLNYFRQSWLNGDFEKFPEIEIRSQEDLNGANGAFAASINKIYLSKEYILQNSLSYEAIVDVLLEEIGHFVDANINKVDTAGDEGGIFSAVVQGVELDETQVESLKVEDDTIIINIEDKNVEIEQDNDILSYDDVEISFRAFIPSPAVSLGDSIVPGSFAFGGDNRDFQYGNPDAPIVFGTPPVNSRAY